MILHDFFQFRTACVAVLEAERGGVSQHFRPFFFSLPVFSASVLKIARESSACNLKYCYYSNLKPSFAIGPKRNKTSPTKKEASASRFEEQLLIFFLVYGSRFFGV